MGATVVGIFPNHDAISKLADSMKSAGLGVDTLKVVSNEAASDDLIDTGLQFLYSGDAEEEALSGGVGIITSMGGMSVPGLNETMPRVGVFHSGSSRSVEELLNHVSVPGHRYDDYGNALDSGRSVASFPAGDNVDKVKELFRSAGANLVEVY